MQHLDKLLDVVSQKYVGAKRNSNFITYKARCIVGVDRDIIMINCDSVPGILDVLLPYLNANAGIKEITLFTEKSDQIEYDNTVVRRVLCESRTEIVNRAYYEWYLGDELKKRFTRSVHVVAWCGELVLVLEKKLDVNLIRVLSTMLFFHNSA